LWAQGCFFSGAWGTPFSAEIKIHAALPSLRHMFFGLRID
jgi:hypothetical protein